MDLKGSLVDTNFKIYPNKQFIEFVNTISLTKDMPHNIKILKNGNKNKSKDFKSYSDASVKKVHINDKDMEILKKIKAAFTQEKENISNNPMQQPKDDVQKLQDKLEVDKADSEELNINDENPYVVTSDLDWIYAYIIKKRANGEKDIPYLHELLEGASIEPPKNQVLKRNPVLEARCVTLRAQQEAREYRKMTKTVDNVRMRYPEDSVSYQLKQINRQLIAVGQFVISIFAGFLFGFRGVEWMVGNLDFGVRLLLGVMCALVIAIAEIYFLAKQLNEELYVPEAVQLGGPTKFSTDDSYNTNKPNKDHQD